MKKDNKNKNASKKNMSSNKIEAAEEILIKEKFQNDQDEDEE